MSIDSDSLSEEKSIFRPFTRESLQAIEQRIAEEHARQKELEQKRAAGLVRNYFFLLSCPFVQHIVLHHIFYCMLMKLFF